MQSELKPCPFCGGNERGMNCLMGSWTVGCSCGVLGGEYETEAEAIAAWNTRASDAEITRLTEALRAAEEREKALREAVDRLRSGYDDAISGYRYILTQHGRLEGVGFTRVMDHYHEWVVMPQREGLMAGSHTLAGAKP